MLIKSYVGAKMKKSIYLFSDGVLKRKDHTLLFIQDGQKRALPIQAIEEIMVFGEIDLNKRVLELLTKHKIPLHFFNYYEYYVGSYYPRTYLNSGYMTIQQVRCYLEPKERLYLARSFVKGAIKNIQKNLAYYKKKIDDLEPLKEEIDSYYQKIDSISTIEELMGIEAQARKSYYDAFGYILLQEGFVFGKRTKRPPKNPLNALISFGNSLLYMSVLTQIYHTHLDPRIGYLHESNQRSFSLNLDIAEVFKPILVDRVIFSLINRKQISLKHFDKDVGYTYLNEQGRKIFVQAYEEKLQTTIKRPVIGKVSYKRLLRLECYKLYKHFMLEDLYKPFVSEW